MKDDGPFVLPDNQLTAGDQICRLHTDGRAGWSEQKTEPAQPDRSIDQSATRVSATRYGAHAAADQHEGSTGTGASVWTARFLFASSSLSHSTSQELHAHPLFFPFKSQQPRGRKKPNATITPHRTRTTLHISIRMQGNYCRNLSSNSLGAQRRQEREALACCSSPPSPSSSGGAATGVYERAGLARAARHPPASAVRRNESCLGQPAGVGGYELQLRAVQALQIRQQRRPQLQVRVHHAHHHSLQGRRANANAAQGKRLDGMVGISSSFFFFSFIPSLSSKYLHV